MANRRKADKADEQRDAEHEEKVRRIVERQREVIEARERDRDSGEVARPPRNDPRHTDQSVLPGQDDVPAGGTSGGEMRNRPG